MMTLIITDAARKKRDKCSYGFIIKEPNKPKYSETGPLPKNTRKMVVSELRSIIYALRRAKQMQIQNIIIHTDNQFVPHRIYNWHTLKDTTDADHKQDIYECRELLKELNATIKHVIRPEVNEADRLIRYLPKKMGQYWKQVGQIKPRNQCKPHNKIPQPPIPLDANINLEQILTPIY